MDSSTPSHGRKCESRRKVAISVRIRMDGTWHDATVLNVSSQGLMLRSHEALKPGGYLELRHGTAISVVGRIV